MLTLQMVVEITMGLTLPLILFVSPVSCRCLTNFPVFFEEAWRFPLVAAAPARLTRPNGPFINGLRTSRKSHQTNKRRRGRKPTPASPEHRRSLIGTFLRHKHNKLMWGQLSCVPRYAIAPRAALHSCPALPMPVKGHATPSVRALTNGLARLAARLAHR